jgi:type IV pilus assembly protein PilE
LWHIAQIAGEDIVVLFDRRLRGARGFTLIELLVGVTIVAILASIALPSYGAFVVRSRRSEAQQLMTTIVNREAQYLLDARTYTTTLGIAGLNLNGLKGWTCETSCTNGSYTVAVTMEGSGFRVTSTPSGKQASDGVLVLKSTGERSRTVGGVDKGW